MSGTNSFTAGNITITGFDSDYTYTGAYDSGYAGGYFAPALVDGSDNPGNTDDYLWNWGASTDAIGNSITGGDQVAAAGSSSGDSWSLSVSIQGDVTSGMSIYYQGVDEGSSFTLPTGTGETNLAAAFQAIDIVGSTVSDTFAVQFTLTDTTVSETSQLTEYFDFENPCYLAGTRIATPAGETAVEALRIGDLVATSSGVAKPVKWIGRRAYTAAQVAANAQLRPVLVRKDALAAGMPHRDLYVSAMHALFIDDVFIPAAALINGVTVLRSDELAPVEYIHIELQDHDVIFAEGAPAETFVDDNSRLLFDNADEYYDIYGAEEGRDVFSAPRVEEGFQLEAVRRRLAARAGLTVVAAAPGKLRGHIERCEDGTLHGWAMDEANKTIPVELDVLVDGESVARVLANRYRTDLDHAGLAGGRCAFSVTLPASVTSLSQVSVRRAADGAKLPMPKVAALAV